MDLLLQEAASFGITLNQIQSNQFQSYYSEMVKWNKRVNLTSVTNHTEIQIRHFLDSLIASTAIPQNLTTPPPKVLDVGSGAGFPGMALKIAFPSLRMTLLESTGKKTEFLNHLAEKLNLENLEICTGRAETLAHEPNLRESYDVILSRGVAKLNTLAELTLPFCKLGGISIAHKTMGISIEVQEAGEAIKTMGGYVKEVKNIVPNGRKNPTESSTKLTTALVILGKIRRTPSKYPRRPGIPAKKPI